jgi:hypothetical protein
MEVWIAIATVLHLFDISHHPEESRTKLTDFDYTDGVLM